MTQPEKSDNGRVRVELLLREYTSGTTPLVAGTIPAEWLPTFSESILAFTEVLAPGLMVWIEGGAVPLDVDSLLNRLEVSFTKVDSGSDE